MKGEHYEEIARAKVAQEFAKKQGGHHQAEETMKRKIQTMKALTLVAPTAGRAMRTTEVLATTSLRQPWMTKTRRSLVKEQVAVLLY
jgi:hypothetical protein